MKTTRLLLAAALCAGFVTLSFAGPGPDYFARVNKAEKEYAQAKAKAQPAAEAPKDQKVTTVATCATCGCPAMKKS